METVVVVPDVADAALPRSNRACALVCAHLQLAANGIRLGAAGYISMGLLTGARDLCRREDCLQHFAFRGHARVSLERWYGRRRLHSGYGLDGSADTTHSGEIPEHPGFVARSGRRRDIPRRRGPATPLSPTDLIRRRIWIPFFQVREIKYKHSCIAEVTLSVY